MVGSSASLPEMNPRAATNVSAKTRLHVPSLIVRIPGQLTRQLVVFHADAAGTRWTSAIVRSRPQRQRVWNSLVNPA